MPFTPFHFGPGLFLKGIAPPRFSWTTFIATQVLIDCEPLYYMVRGQYPVHRELHTFLGATLVGGIAALIIVRAQPILRNQVARHISLQFAESEFSKKAIWAGGLIGGLSHPLLDGLMHHDIRPFYPWSVSNILLDRVGLGELHLGCMLSGVLGFVLVWIQSNRKQNAG